jgi:hypothetical protein
VLESATERLERLRETYNAHLEVEGLQLVELVADHVLSCVRHRDPNMSLAPVVEVVVAEQGSAARRGIPEAVASVVAQFERTPPA